MKGIRATTEDPCCSAIVPEYSPAAGTVPESVTVRVAAAPAASVLLERLAVTAAPERLPGSAFTEQHTTDAESVAALDPILVRVIF
jgi:hypothetical protein